MPWARHTYHAAAQRYSARAGSQETHNKQENAMPTLTLNDGRTLTYQIDGNPNGAPLVFINSLGTNMLMWDAQVAALDADYRIVRYNMWGHPGCTTPEDSPTVARLGNDLLALLDHLNIASAHVCGLSLGGLTAQWLAINAPERIDKLILADTAARIGNVELWQLRIDAVLQRGMAAVTNAVLTRFFSERFRAEQPQIVAEFGATIAAIDARGYAACCTALRDADLRGDIQRISAPTLILVGALDESTTPAQADELHAAIEGSQRVVIENAAHLSNVEQPEAFNEQLQRFLDEE
jgi:3-oxoadipate enol-lactonase